jgi:hypothetical protein
MSRKAFVLALAVLLAAPSPAWAAGAHLPLVSAGILGSIFGTIGHAVLGAFSWTIGLASKFVLTTIGALVKLLIPHSWVSKGLQIMEWIVAVPNYAGKIGTPGGGQQFGFGGINALRDLFMWLGIAVAPLSLTYATSRAMIGESEPIGIPVVRVVTVAVVVASYPYWWSQAAALCDQITHTILTLPDVSRGLYKLMEYAVDGVALGGWQLIDLGLMAAIGLELLGLIFLKVVLILLGALLYATGPLMVGLVPTRAGGALARAWSSAVAMLFALGIGWATMFAVGALLIGDAGTAGPLIAGNSTFGALMGGLMLALAGLASLWLCLKLAREAGSLLRLQLAGMLALGHSHSSTRAGAASLRGRTTGESLRDYGSRLARASTAAGGEFAAALPAGAALASAGRAAGYVGRHGLIGTAAAGARAGAQRASGPAGARLGRSRAGAVAVRMARAGTASWTGTPRRQTTTSPNSSPRQQGGTGTSRGAAARASDGRRPAGSGTSRTAPRGRNLSGDEQASTSTRGRSRSRATRQNGKPSRASRPSGSSPRPTDRRPAAPRPAVPPAAGPRPAAPQPARPQTPARSAPGSSTPPAPGRSPEPPGPVNPSRGVSAPPPESNPPNGRPPTTAGPKESRPPRLPKRGKR